MTNGLRELAPELLGVRSSDPHGDLIETERFLGLQLPALLRGLLLDHGGAVLFGEGAQFYPEQISGREGRDGRLSLLSLYGPGEDENGLRTMNLVYQGQVPATMIVIGDAPGGDQVCLDSATGRIFFWCHDACDSAQPATLVAEGFDEFVKGLRQDEVASSMSSDGGVIEEQSFLYF